MSHAFHALSDGRRSEESSQMDQAHAYLENSHNCDKEDETTNTGKTTLTERSTANSEPYGLLTLHEN